MDADRILDILAIVGIIAVHSAGLIVVWMTYGSEPDPNEAPISQEDYESGCD